MVTQTHKLALILKYGVLTHVPKEKAIKQCPGITCPITHEVYKFTLKGKYHNLASIVGLSQAVKPEELHKFLTLIYENIIKDIEK